MTATREEAAQKAEAAHTNSPGTCQLWTRTLYGAPSAGDQDHDGDADAVDGWASEPRTARHPGDRNPPRGVPVAWDGGSHGYGHRAISLGGGKIRSTDAGGSGKVATVDLDWPEKTWGLHYLGWSETIDGQPIPDGTPPKPGRGGLRVDLVDISHYQDGKIDYATAKRVGVQGGYHKATEGTTFVDPNYSKRRAEFAAAGLPFGAYHFARPSSSSGAAQADHFLKTAGVKPGDLAPMLDLEGDGGLAKGNLTSWVGAFVRRVHKATGVRPIIYTHFDLSDAHHCKLWVARYSNSNAAPVVPAPWSTWDVRQFSDGKYGKPSTVAGFGRVDLDMMREGLSLADITVPGAAPDPTPEPPPKHSPHHARRVATLNVKSYPRMPIEYVNEDLARAAGEASLLLLQEIDPKFADYTNAVRALPGFEADHLETEDVTAWRTSRWARIEGHKQMTHPGKAKVSPNRYVTWTVLEQADGARIAAVNTHAVSKAFWSAKRGVKPTSYAWRRKMWNLHVEVMGQVIADLVDRQGITVVVGGDMNHRGMPRFHPDQVNVVNGSLDALSYIPAASGARITVRSEAIVKDGWRTDHPMLKATLKVSA